MEPYDAALAPRAFGLHNTGALCYFNSLLQLLVGCTAFLRAVEDNAERLAGTATGRAVVAFVRGERGGADMRGASAAVFEALLQDLREKKPGALKAFGPGQQSASEAFVFLMEMLEPAPAGASAAEGGAAGPLADVFQLRHSCEIFCRCCRGVVSRRADASLIFYLGFLDRLEPPARTPEAFAAALTRQVSSLAGFDCPECSRRGEGGLPPGVPGALRVYTLALAPDVLVCNFDRYTSDAPVPRYFPPRFELRAEGGGVLRYALVGQVEHSGGLGGGHYWTRGARASGVFCLDDATVSPAQFAPTANTYMVAYHFECWAPAPGAPGAPRPA